MTTTDIQTRTDEAWADNKLSASAVFWNKSNHGGLSEIPSNQGRTTMKLATIALASAFALSSTFAIAATSQHKYKSGVRTHQGTVGMGRSMNRTNQGTVGMGRSMNRTNQGTVGMGRSMNRTNQGTVGMGRYGGSSNSRGGLVGGADPGTYKP
jgi:hypothetical protein